MRKLLCILCCCLLLAGLAPTAYAANVTAAVCTDTVTLNGMDYNATGSMYPKYPLLVYRDITYFPMTYHLCDFLGVATRWDGKTLYIDRTGTGAGSYTTEVTTEKKQGHVTASTAGYPVVINGKTFDNKNAQWPLLNYKDITYFPLTWALAVDELGWNYQWDAQNGLSISSGTGSVIPSNPGSSGTVNPPPINPGSPGTVNPPSINPGSANPPSINPGSTPSDAQDGMVIQGIWRTFGPFLSSVNPESLTVELWSDWTAAGMQSAILKGMTEYAAQDEYLSRNIKVTDIKVSYSFQFPAQVWSGMELKVPFTVAVQSINAYTLPSGKTYIPSGSTNELTAVVRFTGQGNAAVDSAFQEGQAMYQQLGKCAEIGEISVTANTVFDVMNAIQTRITANLASAGLSKQYYIQTVALGSHKTVLNKEETMTVGFDVTFAVMPDASVPVDHVSISKQAVFRAK
ncbi:MAG: hypothetical protein K2O18_05075 [Oscillospiraceae bacterium]|nr:hypothetical protein [Oscillospiraceae bacterium]